MGETRYSVTQIHLQSLCPEYAAMVQDNHGVWLSWLSGSDYLSTFGQIGSETYEMSIYPMGDAIGHVNLMGEDVAGSKRHAESGLADLFSPTDLTNLWAYATHRLAEHPDGTTLHFIVVWSSERRVASSDEGTNYYQYTHTLVGIVDPDSWPTCLDVRRMRDVMAEIGEG